MIGPEAAAAPRPLCLSCIWKWANQVTSWCEATLQHASPLDALCHSLRGPEVSFSLQHPLWSCLCQAWETMAPRGPRLPHCPPSNAFAKPTVWIRSAGGCSRIPQVGPCALYGKAHRCCGNQGNVTAPTSQHPPRGGASVLTENLASHPHPSSSIPGCSLGQPGAVTASPREKGCRRHGLCTLILRHSRG